MLTAFLFSRACYALGSWLWCCGGFAGVFLFVCDPVLSFFFVLVEPEDSKNYCLFDRQEVFLFTQGPLLTTV